MHAVKAMPDVAAGLAAAAFTLLGMLLALFGLIGSKPTTVSCAIMSGISSLNSGIGQEEHCDQDDHDQGRRSRRYRRRGEEGPRGRWCRGPQEANYPGDQGGRVDQESQNIDQGKMTVEDEGESKGGCASL